MPGQIRLWGQVKIVSCENPAFQSDLEQNHGGYAMLKIVVLPVKLRLITYHYSAVTDANEMHIMTGTYEPV